MKQPLTGTERIYADIIMDRIRVLGYRFERRKLLTKISLLQPERLEWLSAAPDYSLDREAEHWGLKQ